MFHIKSVMRSGTSVGDSINIQRLERDLVQLVLIGFIQGNCGNLIRKGLKGPDSQVLISDALFLLFRVALSWLDRGQL